MTPKQKTGKSKKQKERKLVNQQRLYAEKVASAVINQNGRMLCSEEEFKALQKMRPELERQVSGICEPPFLDLNDFSSGAVWPQSVVAAAQLYDNKDWGNGHPEVNHYYMRADLLAEIRNQPPVTTL